MFLFRWITTLLATVGYIVAVVLCFFAFFPLQYSPSPKLKLSSILNCEEKTIGTNSTVNFSSIINTEEAKSLKDALGSNLPSDIIDPLVQNINNISGNLGSKTKLSMSYCDFPRDAKVSIDLLEKYLESKKQNYTYGSADHFVTNINKLPFAQITSLEVKIPTMIAKSSYCLTPVNKSDIYLFSIFNVMNVKKVIMFNITLVDDEAKMYTKDKVIRNLLETGQYIKAKVYCNG